MQRGTRLFLALNVLLLPVQKQMQNTETINLEKATIGIASGHVDMMIAGMLMSVPLSTSMIPKGCLAGVIGCDTSDIFAIFCIVSYRRQF